MSNHTQGTVLILKSNMDFRVLGLNFKSDADYTGHVKKKKQKQTTLARSYFGCVQIVMGLIYYKLLLMDAFPSDRISGSSWFNSILNCRIEPVKEMDTSLAQETMLIWVIFLLLECFWRNLAVKYPELNWKRWDLH